MIIIKDRIDLLEALDDSHSQVTFGRWLAVDQVVDLKLERSSCPVG